jgi:hypothetical protein
MATLDQLPAEQRAIVELVVQRGRSYDALADVLQVPSDRVRELARDALSELSPRTAQRVDSEWRGKVADYLLGQQPNADQRATREYLKESETARAWALSLLDSLDPLYPEGAAPAVPEPDVEAAPAAAPEPVAAQTTPVKAAETAEDRIRARERERARKTVEPETEDETGADDEPERKPAREKKPLRKPGALSPEAQAALRRRRILGIAGGLLALAAVIVAILAIAGVFSSDDNSKDASASTTTTPTTTTPAGGTSTTGQQPLQVLGQITLNPINGAKARGLAYIVQQGKQRFLVVQAQVPPLPNTQKVAAYEVWLYNSNQDARSLGAQYTNTQGILQGRAPLPPDFAKFKNVDISRELFSDKNTGHGNASVLRGAFSSIKKVPQQQGGTSTTPAP